MRLNCAAAGSGAGSASYAARRILLGQTTRRLSFETLGVVATMKTWMCLICGWIYDEAAGAPEEGIAPGTRWEDVPVNWTCPECGARKEDFEMIEV